MFSVRGNFSALWPYITVVSWTLFAFNTQDEISGISVYLLEGRKEIFLYLF